MRFQLSGHQRHDRIGIYENWESPGPEIYPTIKRAFWMTLGQNLTHRDPGIGMAYRPLLPTVSDRPIRF